MSDSKQGQQPGEFLNMAAFEEAAGGDRELMAELAALYVSDTDARLPELLAAAADGDLERFGRLAHGLKGSSASIGAELAASAFRQLEEMGRNAVDDGLDEAIAAAQAAYARTRERLHRLAA